MPVLIAGEHDFERRTRLRDASLEVVEATNRASGDLGHEPGDARG